MSCFLPHFNTFTTPIPIPTNRHHHIILQIKLRRPHCILSPSAPSTALLEFDAANTPWSYVTSQENFKAASSAESLLTSQDAVIAENFKAASSAESLLTSEDAAIAENFKAASSAESLLTSEDAAIAYAASEALALAKAAAKLAKDATLLVKDNPPQQPVFRPQLPSAPENLLLKWVQHMEAQDAVAEGSVATGLEIMEHVDNTSTQEEEPTFEELEDIDKELLDSIDARSGRQTERKARRLRASGKAATNIVSFRSGSTSRKKRVRTQQVDYSDPLRYLRTATRSSKLLTVSEEINLSAGIQDLIKLEKLQEELTEKCGSQPTFSQWATMAGVDQKTLRKRLNYGERCKEKMIKSNIRLVISVAKNYQKSGMSLQDLVQEGCRGLVKGAEKYDASKGFKFSTYAHWWIKQAVGKALSDQSRIIRLPFNLVRATYKVREARKQLYSENGRQPDDKEIAEATGLSMKTLTAVYLAPKSPRSLERKIGINQSLKPSEVLSAPEAETAEEQLIKQLMKKDLEKVLDCLNPREKQVIRWRFGMDDGRMKALQEIGEMIGVSRERVRQIELCGFSKLKNRKRAKHLEQYMNLGYFRS